MDKKSYDGHISWTSHRPTLPRSEKSKYRLTEDSSRRSLKAVELRGKSSDESLRRVESHLEGLGKGKRGLIPQEVVDFEEVEYQIKATQTAETRDEKGLQISIGRQVSRPPTVLSAAGCQTEKPDMVEALKENLKSKPAVCYALLALAVFLLVFGLLYLASALWPPPAPLPASTAPPSRSFRVSRNGPVVPPPPPDKSIINSIYRLWQTCSRCSQHREI